MSVKNKLTMLFKNIDSTSLEDLPKKGLKIGVKFDNNFLGIILDKSKVDIVDSLDRMDNEIVTDEISLNEFLEGKKSLIDLIIDGKILLRGKLSNLLKIISGISNESFKLGLEESNICKVLKAVFEGICNRNDEILKQIRNFNAAFQFSDFQGNECCLDISGGRFAVTEGRCNVRPTASISAEREVWNKIFRGEENIGIIAMNGEAKIEGNLIQAFKLKTIIDKIL
ncbi:SCP2 sterol-binding domain-containing protein [Sulfolobus sp. E11-6]|uniref:SCP2 sterol-binding domain-containing protein n=1 Tax=Sulfolobus sp. E11-6 TaxID=2663020 RepID=UPI001296C378|nr:SCP2 sterol-binding domain-containing protein [Sulfolobus sp. E11-6]QGA68956.1 hypothetical protein GFS33_09725 [Sulfolobus sp. E11-6]